MARSLVGGFARSLTPEDFMAPDQVSVGVMECVHDFIAAQECMN